LKPAARLRSLAPKTLAAAPELAALAMLDRALAVVISALHAEHPSLIGALQPGADDPPARRHAHRLIQTARYMRCALARYRLAVRQTLLTPDSDDLPF
jgi:hypothetical protein